MGNYFTNYILFWGQLLSLILIASETTYSQQHVNPILLYDIQKSFHENVLIGPQFNGQMPMLQRPPKEKWIDFLGYKIASPIGVPACSIMTSQGIALAACLGFDVLTYKTIRTTPFPAHPLPNVFYVDCDSIDYDQIGKKVRIKSDPPADITKIAIANSFGNASFDKEFIKIDIQRSKKSLLEGQVLIVSIFGQTQEEFIEAAMLACQSGADVIEANFSCPNLGVHSDPIYTDPKKVYTDPKKVFEVSKAIVDAIPHKPIIIKVGFFTDLLLMKEVFKAANRAGVRGICGINSVPMTIINADGTPAFGAARMISGVSGNPIRNLALDFIKSAREIITIEKLDLIILGTGGITQVGHFDQFLKTGADIALCATGMMSNPYLAAEFHRANMRHDNQKTFFAKD